MSFPHSSRASLIDYLKNLREKIIFAFEEIEGLSFERKTWNYKEEGGGEIALLRGNVFEKAAVNWSGVGGPNFPLADGKGPFFATGISLITHMQNPHAPTVHFNIRFIETQEKCWFGGGYDLTPMGFPYEEDTLHFHSMAKRALDPFGEQLYPLFSSQAKEYFYIPHRQKERGVGGLFFDHYNTGHFEDDRKVWEAVGESFLKAVLPIYHNRVHVPFTESEKERQFELRAHYAEFNLIYDRGTKFGFQSGGNPEAILCSMPPLVKW
ncbi:MAG: oxygen-dependent coproporphyrinogen oxidase [Parachlamydia sp.]|jgi:coproporphyrinogen III oxidase|nr:oxygen-dependent coproporphyrinogen oxidase [Parachlamydia sp.]